MAVLIVTQLISVIRCSVTISSSYLDTSSLPPIQFRQSGSRTRGLHEVCRDLVVALAFANRKTRAPRLALAPPQASSRLPSRTSWSGDAKYMNPHILRATVSKYLVGLAALGVIIVGCGSATPVTHSASSQPPSHSATIHSSATPISSSSSGASVAAANAKLIAYALASESASEVSSVSTSLAGPVMPYYIRMEAIWDAAYAAAGIRRGLGP